MAVKIRLRRTGKRNAACHRIVVADSRSPRDGRFIEIVGSYDPRGKTEQIDLEKVEKWISQGAQPSDTVSAIIKRAQAGMSWDGSQTAAGRPAPADDVVEAEETPAEESPAAEEAETPTDSE